MNFLRMASSMWLLYCVFRYKMMANFPDNIDKILMKATGSITFLDIADEM